MSLTAIIEKIEEEARHQRKQEQKILEQIAEITSVEYAEQAAEILDSKKHTYSFRAYLTLLERLYTLLQEGMPGCIALESVQTGLEKQY